MRVCRFEQNGEIIAGYYFDDFIVPIAKAKRRFQDATSEQLHIPHGGDLLPLLPPDGTGYSDARRLHAWLVDNQESSEQIQTDTVQLLTPIPRPSKIFLLAGNYAKHIEEGGGVAAERAETFPYVFMKPPTTALNDPGAPVVIPAVSPDCIDWELELGVIIGRTAKGVAEADALDHVAGYTVVNDISNRRFRPNPNRKERDKDRFFDWLHGKWHDSSCPCGPCIASTDSIEDPQQLAMRLQVNGQNKQNSSTARQIFPVAAVIEFISNIATLEPGDIISTGTPAGVGNATGDFLQPGDVIEASIEGIGTLVSPVIAEEAR